MTHQNNTLKKLSSIIILITLVTLFIYYLITNISQFKSLSLVNPLFIILIALGLIFNYFIIGLINITLLRPLRVPLTHLEAYGIAIITGFYNLITPFRGGMVARAVYLKKKHEFPYTSFLATLAASYILVFLIASLLGLFSVSYIYITTGIFSWIIFLIFLAMFFPMLLIIVLSPKFSETKYPFINNFIKVINGWHLIKNNYKVIFTLSLLTLIQILITTTMYYLQFRVFGIEITFIKCLFLSAVGILSLLIAITPAGLGINEAVVVFSALTIGITPTESLSAVLLGRAVQMLVLFVLGPVFSYKLVRHKP